MVLLAFAILGQVSDRIQTFGIKIRHLGPVSLRPYEPVYNILARKYEFLLYLHLWTMR